MAPNAHDNPLEMAIMNFQSSGRPHGRRQPGVFCDEFRLLRRWVVDTRTFPFYG
jgi:hypothetical protein